MNIDDFAEQFWMSAVPQAVLDTNVGCVSLAVNRPHEAHFHSEPPVTSKDELVRRVLEPFDRELSCHCEQIQAVEVLELDQCVFFAMRDKAARSNGPVRDLEFRITEQNGTRRYQVYCADAQLLSERDGSLAVALQRAPRIGIVIETTGQLPDRWYLRGQCIGTFVGSTTVNEFSVERAEAPSYFEFADKLQTARDYLRDSKISQTRGFLADLEEAHRTDYPKQTLLKRLHDTAEKDLELELDYLLRRLFDYFALKRITTPEIIESVFSRVLSPPAYRPGGQGSFGPTPRVTAHDVDRLLRQTPYQEVVEFLLRKGQLRYGDLDPSGDGKDSLDLPGARAAVDELVDAGVLQFEGETFVFSPYGTILMSAGDSILSSDIDLAGLTSSIRSLSREELTEVFRELQSPVNGDTDRQLQRRLSDMAREWARKGHPSLSRLDSLVADIEIRELNSY
jgi:hypothetical protein